MSFTIHWRHPLSSSSLRKMGISHELDNAANFPKYSQQTAREVDVCIGMIGCLVSSSLIHVDCCRRIAVCNIVKYRNIRPRYNSTDRTNRLKHNKIVYLSRTYYCVKLKIVTTRISHHFTLAVINNISGWLWFIEICVMYSKRSWV